MRKKRIGCWCVLNSADVGGLSSTTSESATGEGTVSRFVRSDVCRGSDSLHRLSQSLVGPADVFVLLNIW